MSFSYLAGISADEMSGANRLTFKPYETSSELIGWDNHAYDGTSQDYALLDDLYVAEFQEGATYDIFSHSYFDPFILILYDKNGDVVAVDNDEGSYGTDIIFDFEAKYTGDYYVSASWDQGAYYDYVSISIYEDIDTIPSDLEDVNEAPAFSAITEQAVNENSPAGTVIATVAASDPDGDTLTYSLSGADASAFAIDTASGEIRLASSPDFESPSDADGDNRYALTVTAEDPDGASTTEIFAVEVLDVNEAPVLSAITDQAVDESSPAGTVVITAAASDPDGDLLTFSLGGDDADAFTVDAASGEIGLGFSPDFEAPADADGDNRYDLALTATDSGGASDTQSFTVEVLDVAENSFAGAILPPALVEDMALLYEAALDRQPDVLGLNYFVGDFRQGQSLHDVANTFYRSSEFRSQFSEFDNESYIDQLYQNVLDRQADQAGLDYWITDIEDRGRSHADVLVSFARSQENRDNAEWLSGLSYDESSDNWLI
ncbi:MAG: DUF4214 domain-containing protein [Halomonas sp.]|uniref:DUF4214 domain-containing protein n=1 Tax=Halomonas sp. TaxID=1486246 RepID=UPI0028702360|nr:DUF4214 domain-containing protein [Halomonas sp.]MDR9440413.1 DUF4214 domain-containing protein [Halomonas sp.]